MPPARRPKPPSWFTRGACTSADPSLFFGPEGGEPDALKEVRETQAKSYCADCPISAACLEWSVAEGERHGIWGGKNEDERAELRRLARIGGARRPPVAASTTRRREPSGKDRHSDDSRVA